MSSHAAKDLWATKELGLAYNKPGGGGLNTAGQFDRDRDGVTTSVKGGVSTVVGEDQDDSDSSKGAVQ